MTLHDNHETQSGARGGVWHLHHKPSRGVDADRTQAEARAREEAEQARRKFHEEHQLTLV